ncbi:MAG: LptF/LptG family permease [Alphaproteobacteria bacterium]
MILKSYFFRRLFFFTATSTLALTSVIWLAQSLRFVELIVTRGVSLGQFFYFIFFLLPDLLILSLPIGFLVSVLLTYHRLITDHELVVMRSAGCSEYFLMDPVFKLGGLLALFVAGLTLYVLPLSFQKFRQLELDLRHSYSSAMVLSGEFTTLGSVTLYAAQRDSQGILKGLFIHDRRIADKPVVITAEEGLCLNLSGTIQFVLKRGTRQEMPLRAVPSFLQFDSYTLQLKLPPPSGRRQPKPYEMSLSDLWWPSDEVPQAVRQKLKAEAHQRMLAPFYSLSFGVLAAFFLLNASGQRRSYAFPILCSVLLCTFIQGASLALLQQHATLGLLIPLAYGLVLSPLALFGIHCYQAYRSEQSAVIGAAL